MNKYILLDEDTIEVCGETLYRIQAIRSFGNVSKGNKGGYIASYDNLSHNSNAWVFGNAQVSGDAQVFDNAQVFDYAQVYGKAQVYANARVFGNAKVFDITKVFGNAKVFDITKVFGNARVFDYAQVYGNARVFGSTQVFGDARIFDNAQIFDYAQVFGTARVFRDARVFGDARVVGNARVFGNAQVYGNAKVFGNAQVSGDARVAEEHKISKGHLIVDITANNNLSSNLACTFDIYPTEKIIMYKRVNYTLNTGEIVLSSIQDPNFRYNVGKISIVHIKAANANSTASCDEGLHVSTPTYWGIGNCLIEVEVKLKDIITIQDGKIRCRALKVTRILEVDGVPYVSAQ